MEAFLLSILKMGSLGTRPDMTVATLKVLFTLAFSLPFFTQLSDK